MKNLIPTILIALATTSAFLLNNQPVQAHRRYYYRHIYPIERVRNCYPVTQWLIDEDSGYHPHAYADGYKQGKKSAEKRERYKPRTAGGEFARGFDDGYYGRQFTGQKHIVPNVYKPYTTRDCDWF